MVNNLHLTLSNIIGSYQNNTLMKIINYQSYLLRNFSISNQILLCNIYEYPTKTIHHSLVNFLPPKPFVNYYEIKNYKQELRQYINLIVPIIREDLHHIHNKEVIIKSIYMSDKSIALEAYPSEDILKSANKIVKSIGQANDFPKVKGFPIENPNKFAINLIRFFRKMSKSEKEIFISRLNKINKELTNNPIIFNINNLSLVISDDYLSNKSPEIIRFNI